MLGRLKMRKLIRPILQGIFLGCIAASLVAFIEEVIYYALS